MIKAWFQEMAYSYEFYSMSLSRHEVEDIGIEKILSFRIENSVVLHCMSHETEKRVR